MTETHLHADFVSGTRELAARTGARIYLSDEGDAAWTYAFAASDGAVLLREGDSIAVGRLRVQALHTPGHTPEHLAFALVDPSKGSEPFAVLTGDFLFAGDVGRPDLLERAAGQLGTMEPGARRLFRSVQRFRALPDHGLILPGHGAGSACGKAIGGVPATTLGIEKRFNWACQIDDEDAFVAAALADQPEPPAYVARMKRVNKEGPRPVGAIRAVAWLDEASLVPAGRDLVLLVADGCVECAAGAARALRLVGLDRVVGAVPARLLASRVLAERGLASLPSMSVAALADRRSTGEVVVVDVRSPAE